MCPVTAGWLMNNRAAARVKLPSRATASNARSWNKFMLSDLSIGLTDSSHNNKQFD